LVGWLKCKSSKDNELVVWSRG